MNQAKSSQIKLQVRDGAAIARHPKTEAAKRLKLPNEPKSKNVDQTVQQMIRHFLMLHDRLKTNPILPKPNPNLFLTDAGKPLGERQIEYAGRTMISNSLIAKMNIRTETIGEGSRSSPLAPACPAGGKGARRTDPLSRSLPETELRPPAACVPLGARQSASFCYPLRW